MGENNGRKRVGRTPLSQLLVGVPTLGSPAYTIVTVFANTY